MVCIPLGDLNSGSCSSWCSSHEYLGVVFEHSKGRFRFVWCRVVSGEGVRWNHDTFSFHMDGFDVTRSSVRWHWIQRDPGGR
jgi:hypothetical protein